MRIGHNPFCFFFGGGGCETKGREQGKKRSAHRLKSTHLGGTVCFLVSSPLVWRRMKNHSRRALPIPGNKKINSSPRYLILCPLYNGQKRRWQQKMLMSRTQSFPLPKWAAPINCRSPPPPKKKKKRFSAKDELCSIRRQLSFFEPSFVSLELN